MSSETDMAPEETAGLQKTRRRGYMPERGTLLVVSAPSGAGKSFLVTRAIEQIEGLRFSISYTTRQPRGLERHGEDYFFVSEATFLEMRERGEFLESATVHGNLYGTHSGTIERMLAEGYDVILDIDVQGAAQVRERLKDAVTVFILPPSKRVLETRLRRRNLNDIEDLARRLGNATEEVQLYERFDYVIINDDRDRAFSALKAIIIAERRRPFRQQNMIKSILDKFGGE
ncbi:MAG: guanylate kinase [Blastocatellia bacterium]